MFTSNSMIELIVFSNEWRQHFDERVIDFNPFNFLKKSSHKRTECILQLWSLSRFKWHVLINLKIAFGCANGLCEYCSLDFSLPIRRNAKHLNAMCNWHVQLRRNQESLVFVCSFSAWNLKCAIFAWVRK